jgi:negative regulator of genetic competence, sporulation and motility
VDVFTILYYHFLHSSIILVLRGPYTINHVAQNCSTQHKFAHSRSSQSAPYTINHVAQHAMLRNMIDRVWATLNEVKSVEDIRRPSPKSLYTNTYLYTRMVYKDCTSVIQMHRTFHFSLSLTRLFFRHAMYYLSIVVCFITIGDIDLTQDYLRNILVS